MAGHSRWAQIKHKKGIDDKKRGELFSKLLNSISIAARKNTNPNFNPQLRAAVLKAREHNVSQENINRAIQRVRTTSEATEILLFEAFGPGGTALLIEVATDNKNRSRSEIKKILADHHGKLADPGSVRWMFESSDGTKHVTAKYPHPVSENSKKYLAALLQDLGRHQSVQAVYHN